MRLLSWNLRGSHRSLAEAAALADLKPDLVILQGGTTPAWPGWRQGLATAGLEQAERLGDLAILSRWPIELLLLPWLAVRLEHPDGALDVHTARMPTAKPDDPRSLALMDGLFTTLARNSDLPRLLAADLQAPDVETPGLPMKCWPGRRWDEKARVVHARRWQILVGLEAHGWHDAMPVGQWSHERPRGRWRPDHLLASGPVAVTHARYLHELRQPRGHAPLLAEVSLGPQLRGAGTRGWHWEEAVATHWRGRPLPDGAVEGGGWWVRGSFEDFEAGTFNLEWARAWDHFDPAEYDYAARCWSEDEALDFHLHEARVRELAETLWIQPGRRGRQDLDLCWLEPDLPE
jgi:hypothetical protein